MQRWFHATARVVVCAVVGSALISAQGRGRRPLASADIDDIAQLVRLEDTRTFDPDALRRMVTSQHPEIRRRAALAIGRIADARGGALLSTMREDRDPEVAATVVFATGQLKDAAAIPWLAERLAATATPGPIATEAAIALGKYQAPEARAALTQFLSGARADRTRTAAIGAALLSIGRFPAGPDLAPIVRWTTSPDSEIRWRAAWALFRPRDPAALPHLLRLSADRSADVRFWAVRGLIPHPGSDPAEAAARLRAAVKDPDRRVRTEALRALAQHDDDASFAVVLASLESPDTWLSVSAAEALGRFQKRADAVVPKLVAAAAAARPLSLRLTALTPLVTLAPEAAIELAAALAREPGMVARTAARQALTRSGAAGKARLDALIAEGVLPPAAAPAPRPAPPKTGTRSEADYRRIVERWIVPDYNGARKPRSVWDTPRGPIEIELYPGDSPLGVEHFVRVVESGEIVGTEFGRVVPNFVVQQRAIRDDVVLRDEVSRHGLPRGNLSWASAGLDTGRPGYTLAITPQPHNEGNFTALGRIVSGMDAVERLELGDRITAARMR